MQSRRWWYTAALAVCLATVLPALGDAPPAPGSGQATLDAYVKAQAAKMNAADNAVDAQTIRDETKSFLGPFKAGAPVPDADAVNKYTHAIAAEFGPVIAQSRKDFVRLNGIILVAQIDNINEDAVLREGLRNDNPAVRYWAARGLTTILPNLYQITGAFGQAIGALTGGVTTEKMPLVRIEMAQALGACAGPALANPNAAATLQVVPGALGKALSNEAAGFAKAAPSATDLSAATAEMNAAAALLKGGLVVANKADETALIQGAVDALSFAAQQENKAATPAASGAALELEKAAAELFNAATHGVQGPAATLKANTIPAEVLMEVNGLTGSATGL